VIEALLSSTNAESPVSHLDRNSLIARLARSPRRPLPSIPKTPFEIRSSPDSLGATLRAFPFYLGNAISSIPAFLIS
jgi:hypothetical protein